MHRKFYDTDRMLVPLRNQQEGGLMQAQPPGEQLMARPVLCLQMKRAKERQLRIGICVKVQHRRDSISKEQRSQVDN